MRDRFRLASEIRQSLVKATSCASSDRIDTDAWASIERLQRLRDKANSRGWLLAEQRLRDRLRRGLDSFCRGAMRVADNLTGPLQPCSVLSVHEIMRELTALNDEFKDVNWDRKRHTFSVTTDDIVLDEVCLGPFEICLDLRYLCQSHPYRVVAKDPHPASTSDSTTHPHVQSEHLCEGDGYAAIKRSIADGRFYDFFMIVRQVLETYNPGNAYVTLDDWHGVECLACGDTVDRSNCDNCNRCEYSVCHDCRQVCPGCDETHCNDCMACCHGCDDDYCKDCLTCCSGCGESFCDHCLTEENCDDCLDIEASTEAEAESPESSVHALRMGQIGISP